MTCKYDSSSLVLPILEFGVALLNVRAKHRMERNIGRIAAGGWFAAQRLSHCPDVMRSATAANSDVIRADLLGCAGKIGHLKACAEEWIKADWKGTVTVFIFERLERRLFGRGVVGDRLGSYVTFDCRAYL